MPFETHMDFLELYTESNQIAIDDAYDRADGTVRDEFFTHLYTEFTGEDISAVRKAMERANSLLIIKAALGGGKSTLLHAVLHDVDPKTKYFLFDFKHHDDSFYSMGDSPRQKEHFIHEIFKKRLIEKFILDTETTITFVYDSLQMFFPVDLEYRVLKFRAKYNKTHLNRDSPELQELFHDNPDSVADDLRFVVEKMTCAQMIRAIKKVLVIEKFLLIIDNVDRFPVLDQPTLFGVAVDIHSAGAEEFGTIIAVRSQNLVAYERPGFGGNLVEIVSVATRNRHSVRPRPIPSPTPEFSRSLIEKRQEYALALVARAGSPDAIESAAIFRKLRPYINKSFIEEKLFNLSNHSYREMLALHIGLVRFAFRLVAEGSIAIRDGELILADWEMTSYLYRWLYVTHNPNHEFLLDILGRYADFKRQAVLPLMCDVELVILAWLVVHKKSITRVGELVKVFSKIVPDQEPVFEGLRRLYASNPFCRHIELGDTEAPIGLDEIKRSNTRLQLNPLGREFVQTTLTKFEFLHQCVSFPSLDDEDSEDVLVRAGYGMDAKVEKVIGFLREMKDVHVETLKQIRDNWKDHNIDWESYYRGEFCIQGDLILERIVRSHLSFLKLHFESNYMSWREGYLALLREYHGEIGSKAKIETMFGSL